MKAEHKILGFGRNLEAVINLGTTPEEDAEVIWDFLCYQMLGNRFDCLQHLFNIRHRDQSTCVDTLKTWNREIAPRYRAYTPEEALAEWRKQAGTGGNRVSLVHKDQVNGNVFDIYGVSLTGFDTQTVASCSRTFISFELASAIYKWFRTGEKAGIAVKQ